MAAKIIPTIFLRNEDKTPKEGPESDKGFALDLVLEIASKGYQSPRAKTAGIVDTDLVDIAEPGEPENLVSIKDLRGSKHAQWRADMAKKNGLEPRQPEPKKPGDKPGEDGKDKKGYSWLAWLAGTLVGLLGAAALAYANWPSSGTFKDVIASTTPAGGNNDGCEVRIHPIAGHPDKLRVGVDFCPASSLTVWEGVSNDPSCYPGNNSPGYNLKADAKCPARKVIVTGHDAMHFQ